MSAVGIGLPMGPDSDTAQLNALSKAVRKMAVLESAWKHVRSRGLSSLNDGIRNETKRFDEASARRLSAIQRRLRAGNFWFQPQRGIAKKRKNKSPRPIVVAPVENRIVQRAILETISTLPAIQTVLQIRTSFGGIEGSDKAIALALSTIGEGAKWFVRSDIPNFFTKIPKEEIAQFVQQATKDACFTKLFMDAIDVELENAETLKASGELDLFPSESIGVAQGSALSPLAGNILLRDFDAAMNARQIVCIRYIDDILILGPSRKAVLAAFASARAMLARFGMEAYDPSTRPDKAAIGPCEKGLTFLGCHIKRGRLRPAPKAQQSLQEKLERVFRTGRQSIRKALSDRRRGAASQCMAQTLAMANWIVKGWGESFSFCLTPDIQAEIDIKISALTRDFQRFVANALHGSDDASFRRGIGVMLLTDIETKRIKESTRGI